MSSSNKTDFLELNNWKSSDIPKMEDFNSDNEIVDNALAENFNDGVFHITEEEREKWNSPFYFNTYFGNGAVERTVITDCPFKPSLAIVFAIGTAPSITNFNSKLVQNYVAFASPRGGTIGVLISGENLIIKQPATPMIADEFSSMNNVGYTYLYALFR